MSDIAILADRLTAELFSLTNFEVYYLAPNDSLQSVLNKLIQKKRFKIIYITQTLLAGKAQLLAQLKQETATILTVIPGIGGNNNHPIQKDKE